METMTGRFDQALAFATVAELGSFTRAAERLGVSKAHLSKQVSDLEVVLGVRLMQRTTRRLNLTDAGRLYLGYATRMRDLLLDGERAVSAARSEVDGLIRLSAPTSFGDSFLVDLLDDFRQRHPRIVFDVDLSIMRRDLIGDGYDFAFRATRTLDPSLIARSLGVMREIVVGSPALLARHGLEHVETPAQLSQLEALRNGHFRDEGEWLLQRGDESMAVPIRGTFAINPLHRDATCRAERHRHCAAAALPADRRPVRRATAASAPGLAGAADAGLSGLPEPRTSAGTVARLPRLSWSPGSNSPSVPICCVSIGA
jgi:DNA-binding transcriptional LysR family regulator